MGLFGGILDSVGSLFGGGGSKGGSQTTSTSTTVNPTTNVVNKIDTEPLAEILAQSNQEAAKTQKEAEKIRLINAERDRQLEIQKMKKLDTYLEHAKNGLVISAIAAGLIYVSRKGKKRK